ncbi:MAG: GIY-YIG nuclease family protein, partial [Candidatus Ratteibacteria bacterium]
FDNEIIDNLPKNGGVYRIFETNACWRETIYIGSTNNLRGRIYDNLLRGDAIAHTLRGKLEREPGLAMLHYI